MKKIGLSLSKYSKDDKIDIIVFSEMVLSGYTFISSEDIMPFMEK